MTPEGKVKAEIKRGLKEIGAYQYWPVPTGYGAATVDCYACYKGRFLAIEVKQPGGKATPRQRLTLATVRNAGGEDIVATSWEDVRLALKFPT